MCAARLPSVDDDVSRTHARTHSRRGERRRGGGRESDENASLVRPVFRRRPVPPGRQPTMVDAARSSSSCARWCCVNLGSAAYDGETLPAMRCDAGKYAKKLNDDVREYTAARVPDSDRILLFHTRTFLADELELDATCERVLSLGTSSTKKKDEKKQNRGKIEGLFPRNKTFDLPQRCRDVMEENRKLQDVSVKEKDGLTWYNGDVYVYSVPRPNGSKLEDKFFIRIVRGNVVPFTNCGQTGEFVAGKSMKFLRSFAAAEKALERIREEMSFLRHAWTRYRELRSQGNTGEMKGKLQILDKRARVTHFDLFTGKYSTPKRKIIKEPASRTAEKPPKKLKVEVKKAPEPVKPWGGQEAPHVVVVGAGPAGLSCANTLKAHGVRVTVIEARDRAGGRCNSEEMAAIPRHGLPSVTVDLGASFIHGCHKYNPVFVIAKKQKAVLNNAGGGYSAGWGERATWYDATKGGRVKELHVRQAFRLAQKASELMFREDGKQLECSLEQAFSDATQRTLGALLNGKQRFQALRPVFESIPSVTWAYVASMKDLSFRVQQRLNNDILAAADALTSNETAVTTTKTDNVQEENIDLSDGMVVDGYKSLLIDPLASRVDVKYRRKVTAVTVDSVASSSLNEFGERKPDKVVCRVECADRTDSQQKETIEADYVVVTVPLGVLQKRCVTFSPNLSAEKQRAIDRLGMGVENKVYLRFNDVFWPKSRFLQCTDSRFRFLNLDAYGKKNVLLAHCSPPYACEFSGTRTDGEIVDVVCGVLQRMFKLKTPPMPVQSIVTRWGDDEFAYGAYSYMKTGSTLKDVHALAKPEHCGRLYFAGEACSIDGAQCVHGAVLTGNEAALDILSLGNVAIDSKHIVGNEAGNQPLRPKPATKMCWKCKRTRNVPASLAQNSSFWSCAEGILFNSTLGALGCEYR